jgi:hypothetical protein
LEVAVAEMVIGELDPKAFAETLTDARVGNARRRQAAVVSKTFNGNSSLLEFLKQRAQARPRSRKCLPDSK